VASTREPARDPQKESLPVREYLSRLPAVLRSNPNFMRYLASRAFIILGTMATAFYIVYARKEFGVDDAFAGTLTMVALVSQTLFTPLLGWLADRKGHKWATEVCTALGIGAAILALVGPSTRWLYGVFVLMNASTSGMMVASLSMVMTFAKPDDLPTYIGLTNTLLAVPILVAPVLGGWIVDLAGFRVLFWVALAMGVLGLVTMRWAVREPEHAESPLASGPQEQGALAG
jgi:MFS family permease